MPDPSLEETNDLLGRLVRAVERKELGLTADPPGRVTLYANRVKAPDGCVWYRWDPQAEEPIVVEHQYVRGRLTDLVCYEKSSPEGTTTKVRACLSAGRTRYEIETTLTATSGRGLVAGLMEAGEHLERPITIGAEPADKDQVLFMSVFTDEGGKQYPDTTPEGLEALVGGVQAIRDWMGLDTDPWTDRFSTSEPHKETGSSGQRQQGPPPRGRRSGGNADSASNPSGDPAASSTAQNRHPSQDLYSNGKPSPQEAGQKLVNRVQKQHADGELAREIRLNGATLPEKIRGFSKYADRDQGYLARVTDALGVSSVGEVAVGQLPDLVSMVLDEDTLRQNESFEPDDDLPF